MKEVSAPRNFEVHMFRTAFLAIVAVSALSIVAGPWFATVATDILLFPITLVAA